MAARHNLSQLPSSIKSPVSKGGVLTISGFGVSVRMQSGHLEIQDGVGADRRTIRAGPRESPSASIGLHLG